MLENGIIIFFIFGAFFRAAGEYGKSGLAWGVLGLLSFYIPSYILPPLVAFSLTQFGVSTSAIMGSVTLASIIGFATGVASVVLTYNKLMDREINAMSNKQTIAAAPRATPNH